MKSNDKQCLVSKLTVGLCNFNLTIKFDTVDCQKTTIVDESLPARHPPSWVPGLHLTEQHLYDLLLGDAFSETHVSAAQTLLAKQFLQIRCFQPTLFSQKCEPFNRVPSGASVQIHHNGKHHWVTSTNMGRSRTCQARILDSRDVFTGDGNLPPSMELQQAQTD